MLMLLLVLQCLAGLLHRAWIIETSFYTVDEAFMHACW
jgi:hypothetical protein